jgi:hypothetical protein
MTSICKHFRWGSLALGLALAGPTLAADSIADFGQWLARYEAAPAGDKPGLVAEGVRLAKRREPAMRRLIATQPRLALQRAVPRLAKLPEPVARHLEQHAEGLAEYTVTVACGGPGHRSCKVEGSLELNGQRLTPRWLGRRAHLGSKSGLPVHGMILESGQLAAPPEPPTLTAALAKGGKPRVIIAGQAGQLYRVEVSSDLRQWRVLKLIEGAAKPVEFVDESATTERDYFYRTVTP